MNFSVENVYSSGVLLIIITQLADNFDVISPDACGGSSFIVSGLQTWQRARGEYGDTTRPGDPSPQDHALDRDARLD